MELIANWAARPVFVTSTFQDMQAERDWLWDFVFPAIEERLRRRRRLLEWIDLRLGAGEGQAETEAEREAQVLKVCLDEVRRSRPFLIALIGDRYGWVPPHDRAEAAAGEAAAGEAGIVGDVTGRSVTDLEIDFGVFRDPEQRRRSLFFLRDPLPYDTMGFAAARYADAYAADSDEGAPDRVARLDQLKNRVCREFPDHVHTYPATWDEAAGRVTGLEAFGRRVEEALWRQIEAELAAASEPDELSWQEQEARALDEFAADRQRDFQGRAALLDAIAEFLAAPTAPGADWALCLTGRSGAGKSAVFAEVLARAQATSALVLAHAAGASPRASSVDAMLQRWIADLARFLDETLDLADNADAETVQQRFALLLGRAALQRRVLVVIDALDQFEPTPRGRFMTWLPALWPENARLFATAIPGDASAAVARRPGAETRPLAALSEAEARLIFAAIHARYHRMPDPAVLDALLQGPEAGWSNPLWLYLAVEQVNLLDEDDVVRAEQAHDPAWPMARRLRRLLLDRIAVFPADLLGLYRFSFDHAARRFPTLVPAFLGLIAVGAAGWRESDFRTVLPELTGQAWDDLSFAYLRRLFRGQLRPRGALEQWGVAHAQMREAIRAWLPDRGVAEIALHAALAQHLLVLPADDPLRQSETMRHLLGAEDWSGAGSYYVAQLVLGSIAAVGATQVLAEGLLAAPAADPDAAVRNIKHMVRARGLSLPVRGLLAQGIVIDLYAAVRLRAPPAVQAALIGAATAVLTPIAAAVPGEPWLWQQGLCLSHINLGDVSVAWGDQAGALQHYRDGLAVIEGLPPDGPGAVDVALRRYLAMGHNKIGSVLQAQGDFDGALTAYRTGITIGKRLAAQNPDDRECNRDLSANHNNIGDIMLAQGNLASALQSYRDSLAIFERLAEADPGHTEAQRDLSVSYNKIGDLLMAKDNQAGALQHYQDGHAIRTRLARADPGNPGWQRDLWLSYEKIGGVLAAQGDRAGGLKSYRECLAIAERLAAAVPGNAERQRDLWVSYEKIGDMLVAQRDLAEALRSYRDGLAIAERLTTAGPCNDEWMRDLPALHRKIGDVLAAQGDPSEALKSCRDAVAVNEGLVAADPDNTEWQLALYAAHDKVGNMLAVQGDRAGALKSYRLSRTIRERLAERLAPLPGNAEWWHDLSVFYEKLGNMLMAQGDGAGALKSYRDGLTIAERLAAADPGNADWQRNLFVLYNRIGDTLRAGLGKC